MSSNNNTIVFTHGGGRFGNQFINAANLLAFDIDHNGFDMVDLALTPYCSEYERGRMDWTRARHTDLPLRWKILIDGLWAFNPSTQSHFIRYDKARCLTIHSLADWKESAQSITAGYTNYAVPGERFEKLALQEVTETVLAAKPLTVLAGWGARCWPLVEKHEERVRNQLTIGDPHRTQAIEFIRSLRNQYDYLVGVLVRQGDYREWNDGAYFFESNQYEQWLAKFENDHPETDVGFVIASDETQNNNFDKEHQRFATGAAGGQGHYLESFVELSLCDVVLTPPSTFSACAAFLEKTPIVPLYEGVGTDSWEHLDRHLFDCLDHTHMSESVK